MLWDVTMTPFLINSNHISSTKFNSGKYRFFPCLTTTKAERHSIAPSCIMKNNKNPLHSLHPILHFFSPWEERRKTTLPAVSKNVGFTSWKFLNNFPPPPDLYYCNWNWATIISQSRGSVAMEQMDRFGQSAFLSEPPVHNFCLGGWAGKGWRGL